MKMKRRRPSPAHALARQFAELAGAVPHVVAHRLARMTIAGPAWSARDRKEFTGMVSEKQAALVQSWQAMFTAALQANSQWAATLTRSLGGTPAARAKAAAALTRQFNASALSVASKGLAPVHRKATANARRLARTKLR
jgi:hypothetical protein